MSISNRRRVGLTLCACAALLVHAPDAPIAGTTKSSRPGQNAAMFKGSKDARASAARALRPARSVTRDSAAVRLSSPTRAIGVTVLVQPALPLPTVSALEQNYPNPFHTGTVISYAISRPSRVTLGVFSLTGQRVATLVASDQQPGRYNVQWDRIGDSGSRVVAGVYFYRLDTENVRESRKLTIQ